MVYTGGLIVYGSIAITLFWLFQSVGYFWMVNYPIHYKSFKTSKKLRTIHLISVVISFSLPTIPLAIISLNGGFVKFPFLVSRCSSSNLDAFFYGVSVPVIIMTNLGLSLLIISFWQISNMVSNLESVFLFVNTATMSTEKARLYQRESKNSQSKVYHLNHYIHNSGSVW